MKTKLLNFLRLVLKFPAFEGILANLTNGKTFGGFITKLPANHYQYPVNSIREVERDGIKYRLDISDTVDWYIYFGFKEISRQRLYELIKPGITMFDVGANVGDVSLHAAKFVGASGKVYAFEPDYINFKRLSANIELNNFRQLIAINKGLGDKPGKFTIGVVDEGNRGMNRITGVSTKETASNTIDVTTMDILFQEMKIDKVDVIKIDVEGFEMNVLKGGTEVISKHHPVFFIELDDNNLKDQGSSATQLVDFLESKGYKINHAETGEQITASQSFKNCHFDIIAKFKN